MGCYYSSDVYGDAYDDVGPYEVKYIRIGVIRSFSSFTEIIYENGKCLCIRKDAHNYDELYNKFAALNHKIARCVLNRHDNVVDVSADDRVFSDRVVFHCKINLSAEYKPYIGKYDLYSVTSADGAKSRLFIVSDTPVTIGAKYDVKAAVIPGGKHMCIFKLSPIEY